jgi:hypothetical protein
MDVQITSDTVAQGYQLRSPWGEPVLSRRRYLQTLGMQISEGADADPDAVHVLFRMRMRLDADFGIEPTEVEPRDHPHTYVGGLQRTPVDLMYGYVEARNLARGLLALRLGRQYLTDPLGWWSFDGALMRVQLPVYMAFDTYGGFEQRGGLPLSTPRFEREGVWRGDRQSLDAPMYPEFLDAGMAPAYGAVVETWQLPVVHARLAYRRVWNTGQVVTNPFPTQRTGVPPTTEGMRTSSERLGGSIDLTDGDLGVLRGGAVYDMPYAAVTSCYGALDAFASERLTLGADVDRVIPTFDGDAIWSFFWTEPTTTLLGRGDLELSRRYAVAASSGVRWVDVGTGGAAGVALDLLARASGRLRLTDGLVGLTGMVDAGERGRRWGGDLVGERWFEERYGLSGRMSVYEWQDDWKPDRSATSVGYMLGGAYRAGHGTRVTLEWEHDTNRLVGQRYRLLAMLQLVVSE